MKKLLVLSLTLGLAMLAPGHGSAQKPMGLAVLMHEKLESSKTLLEGIALADYKKIGRSADTLIQLSKNAEWFVYRTPRYELYTNDFRRAAENIVRKARDKNIDGVTLAYFNLTMACVHCHQYVREVREARAPGRPAMGLVAGLNSKPLVGEPLP